MSIAVLVVAVCLFAFGRTEAADEQGVNPVFPLQETFEDYPVGAFPDRWKVRGDENEARQIYQVAEENGARFLRARADNQDVQIGLEYEFHPQEFPVLRWRWRATQVPAGGNEQKKATNDSAAGVYVVFDSRIMPRVVKYVWSSTLPVGTRVTSPAYWRAKVIVLQSGLPATEEWRQETVNFYQDYKTLFDREPGKVQGIALLTDSDATASIAAADYAGFALLPAGALSAQGSPGVGAPVSPATAESQGGGG